MVNDNIGDPFSGAKKNLAAAVINSSALNNYRRNISRSDASIVGFDIMGFADNRALLAHNPIQEAVEIGVNMRLQDAEGEHAYIMNFSYIPGSDKLKLHRSPSFARDEIDDFYDRGGHHTSEWLDIVDMIKMEINTEANRIGTLRMTGDELAHCMRRLMLSEKETSSLIGVAESTIKSWINERSTAPEPVARILRVLMSYEDDRQTLDHLIELFRKTCWVMSAIEFNLSTNMLSLEDVHLADMFGLSVVTINSYLNDKRRVSPIIAKVIRILMRPDFDRSLITRPLFYAWRPIPHPCFGRAA